MKLYLLLALGLAVVGTTSALLYDDCPDVLGGWWDNDGCIWDNRSPTCNTFQNVPYNPNNKCGFGKREHYYYCGPDDDRTCEFLCYKPCRGVDVPLCIDAGASSCGDPIAVTPCRLGEASCGTSFKIKLYQCPNNRYVTCQAECCCKRCPATGGGGTPGRCTDALMAITPTTECCPKFNNVAT